MTIFDQRGQTIAQQYNAAGDINFGSVQNTLDLVAGLQKLRAEVERAAQAGALDEDVAVDVEAKLKKAIHQAQKSEPDKKALQDYLNEAKALLEGVASMAGLVAGLAKAAEMVGRFFR